MRIVVCVKQVSYLYTQMGYNPVTSAIDPQAMVDIVNPYDECAVEEAIKIKERRGGKCEVTVVSMGPPKVDEALRWCLAMGAGRAYRAWDEVLETSDSWTTALVLSKLIQDIGYDLVLCGKQAVDTNAGQVGIYIAEFLNLPQVTSVSQLVISENGKSARAHKALPKGDRDIIDFPLPALLTVDKSLNEPRYPSFPARFDTAEENIVCRDISSLGISAAEVGREGVLTQQTGISLPRARARSPVTIDASLSPADRLKMMMSGGAKKKDDGGFVEEPPEKAAAKILEFLVNNGFSN